MRRILWLIPGIAFVVVVVGVVTFHSLAAQNRPIRARVARQGAFQRGRRSPHESVTAAVDGATLTIVYGRPSMRGRKIFGFLVPFNEVWCPGADEATTLESSRDVRLGTLLVPAGPHTIWIHPTQDKWTLIVSADPSGFHLDYHSVRDLGRIELRKRQLPSEVEQLTFAIDRTPPQGGTIAMAWETTEVSAPFQVQ